MQPLSIGRLTLLFTLVISLLVLGLGGYFWLEIDRNTRSMHEHEQQAARQEIQDALKSIDQRTRQLGEALAHWDETKQQLMYSDYYAIWRDSRVRDAGMVPGDVDDVALYDKNGQILEAPAGPDALPIKLPGRPPLFLFQKELGHEHFHYYTPVHADPAGKILLGYMGMKMDLMRQLQLARSYRYADLTTIRTTLPQDRSVDMLRAQDYMTFEAKTDPELAQFRDLFETSMLRLSLIVLAALFIAAWFLKRLVIHPLRALSAEIDALRDTKGSTASHLVRSTPLPILELENVRHSFNDYQARLSELHKNLEQSSQDFYDQARHDALTDTFNRRAFDEDWHSLGGDQRFNHVALILFDCDHFKAINDTYGHHVGDAVIKAIAQCLQAALRADDKLYRVGGDEFATVLINGDPSQAESVAERCLTHILSHDFQQYGMSEPATISIGVALSSGAELALTELQKRADLAMYTAKHPGGRKIVFYNDDMGGMAALLANREINAVFQALHEPELIEMAYQPVVGLPLLQQDYVEALARIRFDGNLISANAIFPIIQSRNLDAEFDLAVLKSITRDLESDLLAKTQGISINISAPGIVNTKVIDAVLKLLRAQTERKIVVEITETALITQIKKASVHIQQLRGEGALIALDDFGSGYSSLRYLASMPVDLVKFDISMVHQLETGDRRQQLMIEEIANMVITAGYALVAEGIETRTLLDKVISLGFSHAQGFYFGRPERPTAPSSLGDTRSSLGDARALSQVIEQG